MNIREKKAAGGIVVDRVDGLWSLLMILQASDNAWKFPKGHIDRGESPEETAVREVAEETGVLCSIVGDIGTTGYTFTTKKGTQVEKIVWWYLMKPTGYADATHAHEVLELRWVPVPDVESLLTYDTDRELLTRALPSIRGVTG